MSWLNLSDSFAFLKENGINVIENVVIKDVKQLNKYLDFPYVMKLSSDLLHKTEEKAVIIDIFSKQALVKAHTHLNKVLQKNKIKGDIILQKQIKGLELIIGINNDEQFGKVILFGQGGIYTEIKEDTSIKLLPISNKEINDLIYSTKISKLFDARNITYDTKELIKLIQKISMLSNKIQELDLNPVILTKDKLYIIDARIKLEKEYES